MDKEKSVEIISSKVPSEQVYYRKGEICLANGIFATACGFTVGSLFSLLFMKRQMWPMILGCGFGLGLSYSNCQSLFADRKPLEKQQSSLNIMPISKAK
ncbi:hypothetical protein GJ496_003414 [Pomphorhynchus laevis]|nr:hypothetical protein GJ496_003414 [Pomphorhynchus laevis]